MKLEFRKICLAYNVHRPASLELAKKFEAIITDLNIQNFKLPFGLVSSFYTLSDTQLFLTFR